MMACDLCYLMKAPVAVDHACPGVEDMLPIVVSRCAEAKADAAAVQVLQLGQALSAQGLSSALPPSAQRRGQNGAAEQQTHAFWGTQPVAQFGDDPSAWVGCRAANATACSWSSRHIMQQSACAECP